MRKKDWAIPAAAAPAVRARNWQHPDTALRLLLFGERAARCLAAVALVTATAAICMVALIGPEALIQARTEALPAVLSRLRLALSGMFG
ncbi:MAG: hypothetical protein IRZ13_08175 [Acetobacteraceae bacterium]|nr:hypothetical protein [Acetobacteraceae bacterium]